MTKKTLKYDELCSCVEFSPFKDSASLLAVGGESKITISTCQLKDSVQTNTGLLDALSFENVFEIFCGDKLCISNISWSPGTVYSEDGRSGRYVVCACGVGDCCIKMYYSDIEGIASKNLLGHSDWINDLACHPSDPTLMASVSDDSTCRVWDLNEGQMRSEFRLTSPGMSVKWHPQEPAKLLVAEKVGRVRFYDLSTEVPIMSLDGGAPPLMSVDWSPSNSLLVGGVANGNCFVWDISRSSQPLECRSIYQGPTMDFKWCPLSEYVFATSGLGRQVKVHHTGHQKIPLSCDHHVVSDISWHRRIPLLAVASAKQVHCWMSEL